MAEKKHDTMLTAAVERQLDQLLDVWAEHALMCLEQEAQLVPDIFIVTEDLGYDWWQELFARFRCNGGNVYTSWPMNKEAV